jgi:uncharacterized membrane protein YdjX (TVP38/TMEM64 family)
MGLKSLRNFWQTDRRYLLMLGAVGVLPWIFSGVIGWFVAGYVLDATHAEWFMAAFYPTSILTMALGLTPTTFIAALSGFLFGWKGFAGVVITYTAASIVGRWLGIWLNGFFTGSTRFGSPAANQLLSRLESDSFWLLFFCRLSPVLSFALTNAALGRMRFKPVTYVAATLAGMLPRTTLFFYAGTQAATWNEAFRNGQSPGIRMVMVLIFVGVSLVGLAVIVKKALAKLCATIPVVAPTAPALGGAAERRGN